MSALEVLIILAILTLSVFLIGMLAFFYGMYKQYAFHRRQRLHPDPVFEPTPWIEMLSGRDLILLQGIIDGRIRESAMASTVAELRRIVTERD